MASSLLFAGCIVPALAAVGFGQSLRHGHTIETWSLEDGLPQSTVKALIQSDDGFLWLGTFGGLARFDGLDFRIFELAEYPELGSNRILSLHQAATGDLWIGTQNRGVVRYRDGVFRSFLGQADAPPGDVWCITSDSKGNLWFGGDGLFRFRNERFEVVGGFHVRSIHALDGDRGLLLAGNEGVARVRGTAVEWIAGTEVIGEEGARVVAPGPDDAVWVFGPSIVGRLEEEPRWNLEPLDLELPGVNQVIHSAPNSVWLASDEGLMLLAQDALTGEYRLDRQPLVDLEVAAMSSLLRDREGNLWLGAPARDLTRVAWTPFRHALASGAPLGPVAKVNPLEGGGVLVRLDGGGLGRVSPDLEYTPLPRGFAVESERGPRTRGVMGPDGEFVFASSNLLTSWSLDDPTAPPRTVELVLGVPRALYVGPDGTAWIGQRGRVSRFADGELESWELPGTPSCMHQAGDGTLWCAGTGFVAALREGRVDRIWTPADGLPGGELRALHASQDGTIWIASYGGGLCRLLDGEITTFTRADGLLDNALGAVFEDDFGRMWINSNLGVLVLRVEELETFAAGETDRISCRVLPTGEGNGSSGVRTPDGRLWLPTVRGLVVLDPAEDRINPVAPLARVESLRANGEGLGLSEGARISPGHGDLEIAYTAPAFRDPEHVLFRYRLEGYEEEWIDAGERRLAIFTGVPPGSYSFRVAARNEDGLWGAASAPLALTLLPRFYQTNWFLALVVLAVALAILGMHELRLRFVRAHDLALQHEMRERLHAEQELRRSEERLRESTKLEALGRLAGGIAHDFNNVLTAILGHADLLRHQLAQGSPTGAEENVKQIRDCGERAAELTRQLLAFTRQQVRRPFALDPSEVLRGLEPMLRRLLPESVGLEIGGPRESGTVLADRSQLEQVIMNLVLNARDAMPEGGVISIDTSRRPAGGDGAEEVRIAVADTGQGIPDEILERVFEPFFTTKEHAGTGLGLASVQAIVEQSGGRVQVASRPGYGTVFEVFLPGIDDAAESLVGSRHGEHAEGGNETILVCDDYGAVRDLIAGSLRQRGYRVLVAEHPRAALAMTRDSEHPIDLLVTDMVMPGMDGFDLARAVETLQPGLRVLFVTGYDAKVGQGGRQLHAGDGLLQKPFSPSDIQRRVREMLDAALPTT